MSTENLSKFNEAVAASPELQAKLQSIHADAARSAAEKIAALSEAAGTPFTTEEFLASANSAENELSEEQLEAVAGGVWQPTAGNICASIFTAGLLCAGWAANSARGKGSADACQF